MRERLSNEWIYKAEEDFESAMHLVKKRINAVPDSVCFHAQQCIEKHLKAFLVRNDVEPPGIHDLQRLKALCVKIDKDFNLISEQLDILNAYAVNFRYPGEEATVEESKEAVIRMKEVRKFIRKKIGGVGVRLKTEI